MEEETPTRSAWQTPFLVVVAAVALGLVFGAAWGLRESAPWTAEKLAALIEAEVPMGSDRKQIETWFHKHHIPNWHTTDTTSSRSGNKTMPELAGLREADLSGMVHGMIEQRNGRIWIYFFLDKQGRHIGHLVDPLVYSL